ncbi:MAG TPA: dihydrodipicolinate reductase [Anaerolineae bacterium]|nr:dihydrodipicolinate reductase [Anaerolineae bacterium]HIQ04191.1 dihydrodipicolinate reductase [Anaerolineae bacterium]
MSEPIPIIQYGLGPIGQSVARLALKRPGLQLVGAVDIDPEKVGRDIADLLGLESPLGLQVTDDAASVLAAAPKGVALHCTGSSMRAIYSQLEQIIRAGWHVLSTCEELAYPKAHNSHLIEPLDQLAREHGVVVLGTGVNPGLVMDALPITLLGACQEVRRITVTRVVDSAPRRLPLQRKTGAGLTVQEFQARVEAGTVRHVGMQESLWAIADAVGWTLDEVTESVEPVVAERPLTSQYISVQPGQVAGVHQVAVGKHNGEAVITLELEMSLHVANPRDAVSIEGTPNLKMVIPGGTHGDLATAAMVVNSVRRVWEGKPGLRTMLDLPPAYPRM